MSADLDPAALQQVIYRLQSENEILKTQMQAAQRLYPSEALERCRQVNGESQ